MAVDPVTAALWTALVTQWVTGAIRIWNDLYRSGVITQEEHDVLLAESTSLEANQDARVEAARQRIQARLAAEIAQTPVTADIPLGKAADKAAQN